MLDKTATEYMSQQDGDDTSLSYSLHSHEHSTHDSAREDMLKKREGKSATRTVKQAIAIKHAKERRGTNE